MEKSSGAKKILVVEDDENLREALSDEFTASGFVVFQAADGEIGYKTALKEHPDLILIDILMPKMDGITMFKNLREQAGFENIPGIILTNLNDTKTIENALVSGAFDFLVKSDWEPKSLVKRVQEKLGMSNGA